MNTDTGEILAVAIGTSYAVRLPRALSENHPEGTSSKIKWSVGKTMDPGTLFGPDWVVGTWNSAQACGYKPSALFLRRCRESIAGSDFST